jgi:Fur family transcriptional regulator, ferric uptake regulator
MPDTVPATEGSAAGAPDHGGSDDRHERMLTALRDAGGRVTSQRRVVVEELVRLGGHCTAEQLLQASAVRMDSIEPSTVYRILEALERAGAVYHVHFGHGAGVWHLTGDDHHHAVCDRCGAVVEVAHEMLDPLRDRLLAEQGFRLDTRHFALAGRCRRCASA